MRHPQSARELSGGAPEVLAAIGHAHARQGAPVRRACHRRVAGHGRPAVRAVFLSGARLGPLDDHARALDALEQACDDGFDWLAHLAVDLVWDPLRRDPRFTVLLRRVAADSD